MDEWIFSNWFNVLSSVGIIGSLLFTAFSLRTETKERRIGNLLHLTDSHRDVLSFPLTNPQLTRVLDASADITKDPVRVDERLYVTIIVQHLNSAFEAMKTRLVKKPEGLHQDVGWFFSLPIPKAVWEKLRVLQNEDFIEFVEQCLTDAETKD